MRNLILADIDIKMELKKVCFHAYMQSSFVAVCQQIVRSTTFFFQKADKIKVCFDEVSLIDLQSCCDFKVLTKFKIHSFQRGLNVHITFCLVMQQKWDDVDIVQAFSFC